jgi:hypothetical protein
MVTRPHNDVVWFRSPRTLLHGLLLAVATLLCFASTGMVTSPSSHAASAGFWPITMFGDDQAPAVLGAPERLSIPANGSQWTSPGSMKQGGLVVAWARLKDDFAATAIGSVSADGSTWTEIVRSSANANRSMPHLNLVLPVPEGYHFQLRLEGARGGGLEIVDESGGHWFPLGAAISGS